MLKDILLKTAELINRDDIIESLNNNNTSSQSIQNDILRLISYYNYTLETLCENYFNLTNTQNIFSDNNKKIHFLNFSYEPLKIISISKNNKMVFFSKYSKYLSVPEANVEYKVTYSFLPNKTNNINEKINLPQGLTKKILCYGIAAEFLASKDQFDKANYWNNKFMFEIFKSKTSQDRRVKQTFII